MFRKVSLASLEYEVYFLDVDMFKLLKVLLGL